VDAVVPGVDEIVHRADRRLEAAHGDGEPGRDRWITAGDEGEERHEDGVERGREGMDDGQCSGRACQPRQAWRSQM